MSDEGRSTHAKPVIPRIGTEELKVASVKASDTGAQEAKQLGRGLSEDQLKKESVNNEHHRIEHFRDHFERISIWVLYAIAITFGIFGIIWIWHIIASEKCHWLTHEQISQIRAMLTGGVLASVMGSHVKKRLS